MSRPPAPYKAPIFALLGPTNTGKTHYAMDRMASYKTGMIGFPLRLLARENYDHMLAKKPRHEVALITGEEKIIPLNPKYYICTVESMPVSLPVDFLCVDEIQLCADAERGHIFTDRLLHARGEEETLFLGSLIMTQMIKTLLPNCKIDTRDRMSPLTYTGYRKTTRLPPRSATVAFNINDVYRLAELIRAQRGGAAVVLGALSPRTRNAQVELYQNGDVDYLVATDAIGMGLNMDINHVALAATRKYDGFRARNLRPDEIAQIAGRAGRFRSPGTFGVTDDVGELDPAMVQAIENSQFEQLRHLRWRNRDLEFKNIDWLLKSLNAPPPNELFVSVRQADDEAALIALSKRPDIRDKTRNPEMTRLIWDVCAIPDFRKTLTDDHPKLLEQIFTYLTEPPYHLPEPWCAEQIERLNKTEGDLDTLLNRIAYTRTWTYITHVKGWMRDALHWQAVTRQIEDNLSDALHERLTLRFIDKRTSSLLRGLASRDKLLGGINKHGQIVVEGHVIGQLKGWRFMADETIGTADKDAVMRTARNVLVEPLKAAVANFAQSDDAAISVDENGKIFWQVIEDKFPVAALSAGANFYMPKIKLLHNDLLDEAQNKILVQKLEQWFAAYLRKTLGGLIDLEKTEVKGAAKGIAFQLYEHQGVMLRTVVQDLLTPMDKEERKILGNLGLKLGAYYLYHRDTLKPAAMQAKAILYRVLHHLDAAATPLPQAGNVSMAYPDNADRDFYRLMGLPVFGKTCVRVDMVERLNSAVFDKATEGKYKFDPALASTIGVSVETVHAILHDLGFRHEDVTETTPAVEAAEGVEAKDAVTTAARLYYVRKKPAHLAEKPKFRKVDKAAPKTPPPFNKLEKPVSKTPPPFNKLDKPIGKAPPPFNKLPPKKDEPKVKPQIGYNAFAGLAALKEKK